MSYLDDVVRQARDWDDARERSQQKHPGWSNMADCRAYLGYMLAQEWESDDQDVWRAIVGTAMHEWITGVRYEATLAEGLEAAFSLEVEYGGIKGHLDELVWTRGEITDYKFPRLASARVWDDPDVLDERFIQVQGYAAGVLKRHPELRKAAGRVLVRMLVAPVDGTFADWRVYERPFDKGVADRAIARYGQVVEAVAEGQELPRDKPWFFCESWCEFFSLCRGAARPRELQNLDDDAELGAAVERYGIAAEVAAAADKVKRELASLLRGAHGRARGFTVSMTRKGAGKMVPDVDLMSRGYLRSGIDVPLKPVDGSPSKLRVVREKDK